jgi:glycosyltransferase involved in cell wall biosynthesis
MKNRRLKILMVCDLDDWVLGDIAKQLSKLMSGFFDITVLVSHSDNFREKFYKLQTQCNVVHFLSPGDFFWIADRITIPCVVNLWHMVNWDIFDKKVSRADTLCVGSDQWLTLALDHIPDNLPVRRMHIGLDTNKFIRTPSSKGEFLQKCGLDGRLLTFGFAGKESSNEGNRKGLDRLWKCLIRLKKDEVNIPFIMRIIGKGWLPEMIPTELIQNVIIDNFIDSNLLPEFYSSLDYYMCTSRQEGVPYPVLEAMSCECVVISTPVGMVPEIIIHRENGFILPEDNLEDYFMDIIRSTVSDLKFRRECGQSSRETMLKYYSWEKITNPLEYEEIYRTAIQFYKTRSIPQRIRYFFQSKRVN